MYARNNSVLYKLYKEIRLNIHLLYSPTIPLLGIFRENKMYVPTKACTPCSQQLYRSSQKMATTRMPIISNKLGHVHTINGRVLLSSKNSEVLVRTNA